MSESVSESVCKSVSESVGESVCKSVSESVSEPATNGQASLVRYRSRIK